MIGYYVHHHGHGHVMRATTLLPHLVGHEVTGLSTLRAPRGWPQLWIGLDPDADDDPFELPPDPTAGGVFHWVPRGHDGLRSRMSTISRWIAATDPDVVVVDTSVEVATLCRLHGVPVVQMLQPGVRTDRPHRLALDLADRIVAPWPADVADVVEGVAADDPRLVHVGAFSRFDDRPEPRTVAPPAARQVTVLSGTGGPGIDDASLDRARRSTPGWAWTVLGGHAGAWLDDPWPALLRADVVVTHAGQNALAEVAAARRPAVVVPQERPHDEQRTTAAALQADGRLPVVVAEVPADDDWATLLEQAVRRDGRDWEVWNDGKGAARAADVVLEVARARTVDR